MSVLSSTGNALQACTLWSLGTSPWYVILLLWLPESLLRLWYAHVYVLKSPGVVKFLSMPFGF